MVFSRLKKQAFFLWLLVFFCITPVLTPRTVHAQWITFEPDRALTEISKTLKEFIQNTMQAAIVTTIFNTLTYSADRLAYDTAVRIATGADGGEPLFDKRTSQTYGEDFIKGIAGEAIGSLSETITASGGVLSNFNLCAPSSPYILLQFKLGIKGVFERPEPKCDFNKMFGPEGAWTSFIADLQDFDDAERGQLMLTELANMYDPQVQEFGAGLQLYTDVFGKAASPISMLATAELIENKGFKNISDYITGEKETPAFLLEEKVRDAGKQPGHVREEATYAMLANKDLLISIGARFGSVFSNTLISKLQERIWTGLFDFDQPDVDPFNPESFVLETADEVADRYRSLLAVAPLQIPNYSILSEFMTCPGSSSRALYNCVADGNFVSAIARADAGDALTVQEAIDEGLLRGDWPLIPSSDVARNQDAFCYSYGYCYGNLVKLRKARVISIGWELAANASANTASDPVTLQEVLDGFASCGAEGLPDANHPWCNMIDPDWILKYPDTQCRMQAYGETLLADQSNERAQTCVDMPSCIAEDENGTCVGGYGYCVAEENTWRFRGESCPEYAASCLDLTDSAGEALAVLKTTLDPGPCGESSVGCRWYATSKEDQGDGTFAYPAVASVSAQDDAADTYALRKYFTGEVETCDDSLGGCSTLLARADDTRLNVVGNPSFEDDVDENGSPDMWFENHFSRPAYASTFSSDGTYSRAGEGAVSPGAVGAPASGLYQPGIELGQARTYTLSFYARQLTDADTDTATVLLDLKDETGTGIDVQGLAMTGDCDDVYRDVYGNRVTTGVGIEGVTPASSTYERFSCTFTVPPLADASLRVYGDLFLTQFSGYIDSVQLEQGEDASLAVDGYSTASLASTVVKVPPMYLGCTGGEDDPAECDNYAQVCTEQDVGCTLYTPENGDPAVSGKVTELDVCPASCSGYDAYRQEATRYEPDGVDAVYFIPDTATSCDAQDVGCDEFTNLATEDLAYYTELRACVTETQAASNPASSGSAATFYTWEGSDDTGYQLRTWRLLESNVSPVSYTHIGSEGTIDATPHRAPCSSWQTVNGTVLCTDKADADGDGYYDWDSEDCNERDDIFINPSCREFYDADGGIHYRNWDNTVTVDDACTLYRKTTIAGDDATQKELTCTASGGYFDATLGECRYYGLASESATCSAEANGCRAYAGGTSRNSRLVLEEVFESGTLNLWDAPSSSNATLSNESLAVDGHSMEVTRSVALFLGDAGSVCADPEGCDATAISFGGTCTVAEGEQYCGVLHDQVYADKTYTLSVLAKGIGTMTIGFDTDANVKFPEVDIPFATRQEIGDGWEQFTFGPLLLDADTYPAFGAGTTLVVEASDTLYLDNLVLREGEEDITVLRDSWVTPAECDETPAGTASPQYMLGCEEYTTQTGATAYLKSFSSLCSDDVIGCASFFATRESEATTAQTLHATCNNLGGATVTSPTACYYFAASPTTYDTTSSYLCTIGVGESSCLFSLDGFTPDWILPSHISYGSETVVIPNDRDMFLVVTDEVTCEDSAAGCTEFGNPLWSQDRESTSGAESVFLYDLPETYDTTLCAHDELFCDAFTTSDNTTLYMKHPLGQLCEYRTDVTIDGVVYDGWFREETDEFCYGTCEDSDGNEGDACGSTADCASGETCEADNPSYVIGGTESGLWRNGDDAYRGWVGSCSEAYDLCTEFQDVLAQNDGELYGATPGDSYFYLNNDNLSDFALADSKKCNGQVSLKDGCALFYDTNITSLTSSATATEIMHRRSDEIFGSEPYAFVDPVDCDSADTEVTLPDGSTFDPCAQRCVYDLGEINDLTDGLVYEGKLFKEALGGDEYDLEEIYALGTACFDATDCAVVTSESGQDVDALSCATQVRVDPFSPEAVFGEGIGRWQNMILNTGFELVTRLTNDANTVMKVNRDRSCAEWLACSSTQTQWDDTLGSFTTTCNDIALCNDYDPTSGSSFCASWEFDKPEVIYDAAWYAERDTSWYGNDYSGMSIPHIFPVQSLVQADVSAEGYCWGGYGANIEVCDPGGTKEEIEAVCGQVSCLTPDEAVSEGIIPSRDYELVLSAGECSSSQDYGSDCAVGVCEDTGAACADDDQCTTGTCVVGSCYTFDTTVCQTADDCAEGQVCSGGVCAEVGATVPADDYDIESNTATTCGAGETFVPDAFMKRGSCINDMCLLTPDGETYVNGVSEGKICRAYPESSSPFPNDVVTDWYSPQNPGEVITTETIPADALPYDLRSGFENVSLCAAGEDCDCSYTRATFGDTGDFRYYNQEWSSGDVSLCAGALATESDAGEVCDADSDCSSGTCSTAVSLGVCDGGDRSGGYCLDDTQCDVEGNVTCVKTTREDVLYGLQGFCLEHDTSMSILGDRAQSPCLSWLPVDELAGDTDLQAKYTEAGYFADTYACADVALYANIGTSEIPERDASYVEGDIACADIDAGLGPGIDFDEVWTSAAIQDCAERAQCPDGYWTLTGMVTWKNSSNTGYMADACQSDSTSWQSANGYDDMNDCPFVCVPYGATDAQGNSCNPEDGKILPLVSSAVGEDIAYTFTSYMPDDVYFVGYDPGEGSADANNPDYRGYKFFDYYADSLRSCEVRGVEYTDDLVATLNLLDADYVDEKYRGRSLESYPFAGCKDVIQVADGTDFQSFAWTERLLGPSSQEFTIDTDESQFAYGHATPPGPFGLMTESPLNRLETLVAAMCGTDARPFSQLPASDDDIDTFTEPNSVGICDDLFVVSEKVPSSDPASPDFQPFSAFTISDITVDWGNDLASVWSTSASVIADAFNRVNQLFAGTDFGSGNKDLFSWSGSAWDENGGAGFIYAQNDVSDDNYAAYDVRADQGTPPKIWSVDVASCSDDGVLCEEGTENRITINSQDSGDQSGSQFFNATVKFFAAADKNQLPLRRIIVDWGDDLVAGNFTGSDADDNFFKNARGLVDGSQESKCDLGTEWGLTSDSCDPYYFTFSHVYTCSSEVLRAGSDYQCTDSDSDGVYDFSPCWLDQSGDGVGDACAFVPRVHVRDNWGWCSGVCTTGDPQNGGDGTNGCFDVGSIAYGEAESTDECNYLNDVNNRPFVEYSGSIIIVP